MRGLGRWGPWIGLVLAAVALLAVGAHRSSAPSLSSRVLHIAGEVRCPVCQGETAAESDAAASLQIRDQIRRDLLAGKSEKQVIAGLVASYGSGILEKPRATGAGVVVWALPVVAAAAGCAGLAYAFVFWRRRAGQGEPAAPEPAGGAEPAAEPADPEPADPEPADRGEPAADVVTPGPPRAGPGARRWWRALGARPLFRWSGRSRRRKAVVGGAVAFLAGGLSWAVVASATGRLPGGAATGKAMPAEVVSEELQQAQKDVGNGDQLAAVKEYQKILDSDPSQVQALTEEGWLLAQTQQPTLLGQGLSMLASAERHQPGYAPAHLYRGIALLSEDDYSEAVPELEWYLDHHPDPTLEASVRQALQKAQAKLPPGQPTPTSAAPG